MSTAYLTDSWSSITGLASVAYGSPSFYPEVANQVRGNIFTGQVGEALPSTVSEVALTPDVIRSVLEAQYLAGGEFTDFVNLGSKSIDNLAQEYASRLNSAYNELASYSVPLSDVVQYALPEVPLAPTVFNLAERDTLSYTAIASDLAINKLDKLPPDTIMELADSIDLAKDYVGRDITLAYLTPAEYYAGVAYPGIFENSARVTPEAVKSIEQGYIGYPTTLPLDELLNAGFSQVISRGDLAAMSLPIKSLAGLGTIDALRSLSPVGRLSDADRAMYDVDLTSIVLARNGYTIYNPATDSNGDFLDTGLVPRTANSDPGGGLPPSSRTRTPTFS